jgi:hypothetical protein
MIPQLSGRQAKAQVKQFLMSFFKLSYQLFIAKGPDFANLQFSASPF